MCQKLLTSGNHSFEGHRKQCAKNMTNEKFVLSLNTARTAFKNLKMFFIIENVVLEI